MRLSSRDFRLSKSISPNGSRGAEQDTLRSLIIHRLRNTPKAILRLPLKKNIATATRAANYSVYCERCQDWFTLPQWGEEVSHPACGRLFVLELAVFTAVPDTDA